MIITSCIFITIAVLGGYALGFYHATVTGD